MNDDSFKVMLERIRSRAAADIANRYHPALRELYEAERKARIVSEVLSVLGANVPEARELIGEVSDLVSKLRTAEEVTPALNHYW